MTVNIKDVAKAAGVSVASVSRAISGNPGVSEETAKRIKQIMTEMGYRPNLGARSLVKGRTPNIAVAFPRGSSFVLGNPFFSRVLEGIAKVLDQSDYNTLISFTSQQQKRLLETQAVDGVILFAPRSGELSLDWLKQTVLPYVVVGSYMEDSPYPCVRPDDEGGVASAVKELHRLGHRRIGLVNGPSSSAKSRKCFKGYQEALVSLGVELSQAAVIEIEEFDAKLAKLAIEDRIDTLNGVTGLVCAADYLAMGVIKGAANKGLSVPRDLSVIGFGDVPLSEHFIPALSTMHVDLIEIGRQAAALLLDIIGGKQIRKKERVFPMSFIARETSVAPPR